MSDMRTNRAVGSTTGAGAPAPSDRNSLTIGPDGPILLHDVHFLEQMAHFNREKTIERQPHAKRSEEHTSELQSLMCISYAVFCLKKKKSPKSTTHKTHKYTQTLRSYMVPKFHTNNQDI